MYIILSVSYVYLPYLLFFFFFECLLCIILPLQYIRLWIFYRRHFVSIDLLKLKIGRYISFNYQIYSKVFIKKYPKCIHNEM